MLSKTFIITILVILLFVMVHDHLRSSKIVSCKSGSSRVYVVVDGNAGVAVGGFDDESKKCISEQLGMRADLLKLYLYPDSSQNNCMDQKSAKNVITDYFSSKLCTIKSIKLTRNKSYRYSFDSEKLEESFGGLGDKDITNIIFFFKDDTKIKLEIDQQDEST